MKALLDTNALIWWLSDPTQIPSGLLEDMKAADAVLLYSQVSLLEIQITVSIAKVTLDFAAERIPMLADESGLTALSLSNDAIFTLPKLPNVHRDPFDRLLVCEAIQQGVPIISSDSVLHNYPVRVLWD